MSTIHHIWQPASHEDRSPSPRISRTDQCQFRFQLRAGVSRARTGSVARVAVTLAAIGAMLLLSGCGDRSQDGENALLLYCAAGMRRPVDEAVKKYQQVYGVRIDVQYGGSGTLLSSLQVAKRGDLYLAADNSYIEKAREKGLVAEALPLAHLKPVVAVARGNPAGVATLQHLLSPKLRVALANPDAAAIGRITKKVAGRLGVWEQLKANAKVFKPTVTDLVNDIVLGTVDAAVVWDATANQYGEVDAVVVPSLAQEEWQVTIGVLTASKQPTESLRLARYLAARDRGLIRFQHHGFDIVEGDVWSEDPTVLVFIGSMLRAGAEPTFREFEQREGVRIQRVYNGCGVLVSQMRAGARPQAYLSCDVKFMDMVAERFDEPVVLTENDIVIAVAKENPKGIRTLEDLTRADLRVGVCHPEKSALGHLTRKMLQKLAIEKRVLEAAAVQSATGDFLVSQIRAGGLNAVIVYRSNVLNHSANVDHHLDIVEIEDDSALAVQPWAIAKTSDNAQLLKRLLNGLVSRRSRERFEQVGFRWRFEDAHQAAAP